jgi:hypothetical protein
VKDDGFASRHFYRTRDRESAAAWQWVTNDISGARDSASRNRQCAAHGRANQEYRTVSICHGDSLFGVVPGRETGKS